MVIWNRQETWVAVFDILGFKELVGQADNDLTRAVLTSRLDELIEVLKSNLSISSQLQYHIFSDTFIVMAPDLDVRRYPGFLNICKQFINKSIYIELPVRGAISVGPVFISKDPLVVIGSSFLEAYEYCEDQDWIGLLLAPSAIQLLRKHNLEPLRHDFVRDELPLRKKPIDNVLAYRFQNGRASFRSPLIVHLNQMQKGAPELAKSKYSRTVAFIEKHYRYIDYQKQAQAASDVQGFA